MHILAPVPAWTAAIAEWDRWLTAADRPLTTRHLRAYHLRRFGCDHPRVLPVDVTLDDLITWLAAQTWGTQTRRSYRASLRQFFGWLHATGRATENPAFALPAIRPHATLPRPVPDDVLSTGMRTADPRMYLMLMVLTETGMRRGELAKLHTFQVQRDGQNWAVRIVGKGNRERIIPITSTLARVLRDLTPGYAFPGRIDGHLSPEHVGKLVSAALAEGWTAHTIRHRFGTLTYAVERDIRAVQELMGHAKIETTVVYTEVPSDARRRAVMGARLGVLS